MIDLVVLRSVSYLAHVPGTGTGRSVQQYLVIVLISVGPTYQLLTLYDRSIIRMIDLVVLRSMSYLAHVPGTGTGDILVRTYLQ